MKKLLPVILISVGLSFGLAISPLPVMAQGVVSSMFPSVAKLTVTAPSGTNGIVLNTGARIDLGSGANDYIRSNGSDVTFDGPVVAASSLQVVGTFVAASNITVNGTSIGTCASGVEGAVRRQTGTGGTNSGSQTRFCACVSDGAASPTFSWRNLISGTAGNATTCNP